VKSPSANFVFPDFVIYPLLALMCVFYALVRRSMRSSQDELTREYEKREARRRAERLTASGEDRVDAVEDRSEG
jgi:hypothetical protein